MFLFYYLNFKILKFYQYNFSIVNMGSNIFSSVHPESFDDFFFENNYNKEKSTKIIFKHYNNQIKN